MFLGQWRCGVSAAQHLPLPFTEPPEVITRLGRGGERDGSIYVHILYLAPLPLTISM